MRQINPSVKAIAILICGLIISFSYSVRWNAVLIAVCLVFMALWGADFKKMIPVLFPATLAAASIFMAFVIHGEGEAVQAAESSRNFLQVSAGARRLEDALAVGLRIYVYAMLGMLFSFTTDPKDFLYSLMQQCHLPPKFAYGVLAAFHLLPMIQREYRQIRLAYRVRGLSIPPWSLKPAYSALVNALHWAESIAMAMESKGFEENGKRTYYRQLRVKPVDFLWAFGMLLLSVCGLL